MDKAVIARTEAGSLLILHRWQIRRSPLTSEGIQSSVTIDGRRINIDVIFEGDMMDAINFLNTNVCRIESLRAGIDVSTQTKDLQENPNSAHLSTNAITHERDPSLKASILPSLATQKNSSTVIDLNKSAEKEAELENLQNPSISAITHERDPSLKASILPSLATQKNSSTVIDLNKSAEKEAELENLQNPSISAITHERDPSLKASILPSLATQKNSSTVIDLNKSAEKEAELENLQNPSISAITHERDPSLKASILPSLATQKNSSTVIDLNKSAEKEAELENLQNPSISAITHERDPSLKASILPSLATQKNSSTVIDLNKSAEKEAELENLQNPSISAITHERDPSLKASILPSLATQKNSSTVIDLNKSAEKEAELENLQNPSISAITHERDPSLKASILPSLATQKNSSTVIDLNKSAEKEAELENLQNPSISAITHERDPSLKASILPSLATQKNSSTVIDLNKSAEKEAELENLQNPSISAITHERDPSLKASILPSLATQKNSSTVIDLNKSAEKEAELENLQNPSISAITHERDPSLKASILPSLATQKNSSTVIDLNKSAEKEAELENLQNPSISGECIKGRRQRFCKYCERRFLYLGDHLKLKHSNEPDVAEYIVAPTIAAKKRCMAKIIAEGDKVYNGLHPTSISVLRQAHGNVEREMCNHCCSFISIKHIKEHYRKHHPDKVDEGILRIKRRKTKVPPPSTPLEIEQYLNDTVIPSLKNENYRDMIITNQFLVAHANILTRKTVWDKNRKRTIATNLRTICTIIENMMHLKPEIDLPHKCAFGSNYKTFVKAVTNISKDKPSIVDQYALMFKRFVETVEVELLGESDENPEDNSKPAKSWLAQYEKRFSFELGKTSRKEYRRRKFDNHQKAPTTSDVRKLNNYIVEMVKQSVEDIETKPTVSKYLNLGEALLMRIWTFNRRRVGEIDQLHLKRWIERREVKPESEEYNLLSETEKFVSQKCVCVTIQAKLGKPAFILIPKDLIDAITRMVNVRAEVGINENNTNLFAKGDSFIEGTAVMRKYSIQCGASDPETLRGTKLRHHAAVTMQYLSLSPEDLRLMSQRMGHSVEVHMQSYREDSEELHLGRAAKILLAWDKGVLQNFKGKSLDEINVQSDDDSDGEVEPGSAVSEPSYSGTTTKKQNIAWTKSPIKKWLVNSFQNEIEAGVIPDKSLCRRKLTSGNAPAQMKNVSPSKVRSAVNNILKRKRWEMARDDDDPPPEEVAPAGRRRLRS